MTAVNSTLDNLIAIVILLLTLSLVVQSIQGFIKKIFRIKSGQLKTSLRHFFENTLQDKAGAESALAKTLEKFKDLGRVSFWGKTMLDSISKGDLFNILGKTKWSELDATFQTELSDVRSGFAAA